MVLGGVKGSDEMTEAGQADLDWGKVNRLDDKNLNEPSEVGDCLQLGTMFVTVVFVKCFYRADMVSA